MSVRDFAFLAHREVAIDVTIKNIGMNVILVDCRSDYAKSHGSSRNKAIIQPLDPFEDFLSFHCAGMSDPLPKEERTSDERRYRNSLEEGGVFKSISELLVIQPGHSLLLRAIVWNERIDVSLRNGAHPVEARLQAPMLMTSPDSIEVDNNWLAGPTVINREIWLAKKFIPVSIAGQIDLK
nr:hypothetical protein [candidate division Zixibacteria bacterium]